MKIALYSKIFRETLNSNKDLIKENKTTKDISSIKKVRKLLMEKEILSSKDYFFASTFIDLLMHEQELSFNIDELKNFYEGDFNFLGFIFPINHRTNILNKFRNIHGNEKKIWDIDNWKKLEEADNYLFQSMYQFWLQKKS